MQSMMQGLSNALPSKTIGQKLPENEDFELKLNISKKVACFGIFRQKWQPSFKARDIDNLSWLQIPGGGGKNHMSRSSGGETMFFSFLATTATSKMFTFLLRFSY